MVRRGCKTRVDTQYVFQGKVDDTLEMVSNYFNDKFNKKINLLLESKRPRKSYSTKGKLCSRRLYQTPFNDNVFTKFNHIPTSDTTIIFLLDASGSMNGRVPISVGNERHIMSAMKASNAVVSAFAKSIKEVVKDEIKVEVFTKSSADVDANGMLGIKGSFPNLTRVYSNNRNSKSDYKRLLSLDTTCPITINNSYNDRDEYEETGSSTPEYAVLPALFEWVKKNVTTKNVIVFNITDGDTYGNVGNQSIYNNFTQTMREKYLRHVDNITLYIGGDVTKESKAIYGDNLIGGDVEDFTTPMFNTLIKLFNKSIA
tara:strand:+ start:1861 stop:2802 length:942 start_codon:yes stop_codon:yes gene_type:complete